MKFKKTLLISTIVLLFLSSSSILGMSQKKDSTYQSKEFTEQKLRDWYLYFGTGVTEIFVIGVGKQFNNRFSIALKQTFGSIVGDGGFIFSPFQGDGLGLRFSYYADMSIFNNISFDYTYVQHLSNESEYNFKNKGNAFMLTMGYEKIIKTKKKM